MKIDQHGKCTDCGLDYDQARDSVCLIEYCGVCERCQHEIRMQKVIARWICDEEVDGVRWHIFSNLHYHCSFCQAVKTATRLLCVSTNVVIDVTSEFKAFKKG